MSLKRGLPKCWQGPHGSAERRALVAWEQSGRRKPRLSGFSPSVRKQRPEISNACAALACRHRLREVEISQTVFANLFLSCLHAWIFTCAFCATHWEGIHTDFHSIFTTTLGCTLSHNLFDVSEFNYFNGYFWYLKDIFIKKIIFLFYSKHSSLPLKDYNLFFLQILMASVPLLQNVVFYLFLLFGFIFFFPSSDWKVFKAEFVLPLFDL